MDENKSEVEVITEKVKASAIAIIHAAEEVVKPVSKALGLVETEPVTKSEKKAARKKLVATIVEKKKAARKAWATAISAR